MSSAGLASIPSTPTSRLEPLKPERPWPGRRGCVPARVYQSTATGLQTRAQGCERACLGVVAIVLLTHFTPRAEAVVSRGEMLDQPMVAVDVGALRRHAESCLTGGDFVVADTAYAEMRRLGVLSRTDAGNWLKAVHALGSAERQPTLSELVASFPDDQDILEFVAAELWQRADSRAEQVGGSEDDVVAQQAWSAALRMTGPVPISDTEGVRRPARRREPCACSRTGGHLGDQCRRGSRPRGRLRRAGRIQYGGRTLRRTLHTVGPRRCRPRYRGPLPLDPVADRRRPLR